MVDITIVPPKPSISPGAWLTVLLFHLHQRPVGFAAIKTFDDSACILRYPPDDPPGYFKITMENHHSRLFK